jgi:hypothetical protein
MYAEAEKFPGFVPWFRSKEQHYLTGLQLLAATAAMVMMRLERWLLHLFISFK